MFDTRSKIIAPSDFLSYAEAHPDHIIVCGYFDPMWAPHAQRLTALAPNGKLLVIVEPMESPLLTSQARAELVASFGITERVTIAQDTSLRQTLGLRCNDERLGDQQRYQDLAAHVRKRNNV